MSAPSFILIFKCKVYLRIPTSGVSLSFTSSWNNCASAGSTEVLGYRQVLRYLCPWERRASPPLLPPCAAQSRDPDPETRT